jgi:acyl-CoA synthetase (AMP-forming)/AMP-acid ligase II
VTSKKGSFFSGEEIGKLLRGYSSILDFIPLKDTPCISEASSRKQQRTTVRNHKFSGASEGSSEEAAIRLPLTHRQLRKFIEEDFDLNQFGIARGCRIALLLPNGPELAVAVIAALSGWCVVPINATYTSEEIRAELESTQAQAIIILAGATVNEAAIEAATSINIGVLIASPVGHVTGLFRLAVMHSVPAIAARMGYTVANTVEGFTAFEHPETVLLLHTSGTSGNKKLVPYSLDMIITGVGCIVASWNLQPSDVCLNMMPLFHIGGIMRNILSPVLSGGCVITCAGFDPVLFWEILIARSEPSDDDMDVDTPLDTMRSEEQHRLVLPCPTWYYAAPTMHHAILSEGDRRDKPLPVKTVRFIANAAGGLLPVLADALKATFYNATILTSYGMTEW